MIAPSCHGNVSGRRGRNRGLRSAAIPQKLRLPRDLTGVRID